MRYFFTAIVCSLLFSCQGQHDSKIKGGSSTDTDQTHRPKTYPDTIQNKVIGKIQFGISKKTFDKLSNSFQEKHLKNKRYHLGNFQYLIINSEFYQNKLYQVDLFNPWVENDDDLKQIIQGAYDLVTAQYGKPDSTHNGIIEKFETEDLFVWHIGHKRIKIISGYAFNMSNVTIRFEDISINGQKQAADHQRRDSLTHSSKNDL